MHGGLFCTSLPLYDKRKSGDITRHPRISVLFCLLNSILLREIDGHTALEHFCCLLCRTRTAKICTDLFGDDVRQFLRVREPEHRGADLIQPFLDSGKIDVVARIEVARFSAIGAILIGSPLVPQLMPPL